LKIFPASSAHAGEANKLVVNANVMVASQAAECCADRWWNPGLIAASKFSILVQQKFRWRY
jgi:hypothetical protein